MAINPFPDYDSEDDESDMIVVKTVDGGNPLGLSYAPGKVDSV